MPQGRFVSFEGIEGCGKTTQIALLSEYLIKHSIAHTITREPGGTAVGEGIRKVLLNSETIRLTAASELLLFYASRSQNIQEKIKPALERNEIVICDRYYHASMAYQGYGRGIPLDFIRKLTDLVCDPYRPDLTFLLDIEPEIGLARARARNHGRIENEDRFEAEDLEFYNRVREGYLELASEDERIQLLYADRSIETVHRHVLTLLGFD
ncbi:MAG: dTMP kinase [Acidobacteria bacterium 13_1_40CM_56_16]|nr:MAG: dTMP kinase [Acidobacteria bacterium 13_1_40CM_56_16]OLD68282.1 MAG: dTMP kinase [Acidobacteria bacterium 13_1_40CM_2_56_11]